MLRSDWLGIVLLGLDTQERKSTTLGLDVGLYCFFSVVCLVFKCVGWYIGYSSYLCTHVIDLFILGYLIKIIFKNTQMKPWLIVLSWLLKLSKILSFWVMQNSRKLIVNEKWS